MPVYKATVKFTGTRDIEFEAMGDAEASETAAEVFGDMDKGRLNMAAIDIKDISCSRMGTQEINERKYDERL